MPDCAFFLKGFCKEENCKYRHVKVNADATLCKEFQTGFCSKGAEVRASSVENKLFLIGTVFPYYETRTFNFLIFQCDKSHKYLCKSFQKTGNCPKGHRCTLAHQTLSDTKFANNSDISKFKKINSKSDTATQEKISEETSVPSNNRELLNKLLTKRLRRNSEDNKQIVSQPNSEIDSSTQYIALSTEGAPRSSDDFSLAEQMLQKKARDTNCKSMGSASNQPLKRKYFVTDNDDEKLSDYLTFTGNSTRSRENDCRPTLKIIPDFLFLNKQVISNDSFCIRGFF